MTSLKTVVHTLLIRKLQLLRSSDYRTSTTTRRPEIIDIDGLPFIAATESEVVAFVLDQMGAGKGGRIVTPNASILRQLRRDPRLRRTVEDSLVVADGMPIVWASKLLGTPLPARVAGSDLLWSLSRAAALTGLPIFLLGGPPGAAEGTRRALQHAFPSIQICGVEVPQLGFEQSPAALNDLTRRLTSADPALVFVALGYPKQELLSMHLSQVLPRAWFLNCGGSFSFAAGLQTRAPEWSQRVGMEWLYRLVSEPRRLGKRYIVQTLPYTLLLLTRSGIRGARRRGNRGTA